jgi:cytidylate kinase
VVAIDGPSGSGKSTVSRGVAAACGLRYLDTGAVYRAITVKVLEAGLDPAAEGEVTALAERLRWDITADPHTFLVRVDGEPLDEQLRTVVVTAHVSAVSAVPGVRAVAGGVFTGVIGEGGIVVEGRDIASVVTPDAQLKVHLTADPAVRAARRAAQEGRPGEATAVQSDLLRRDELDTARASAPLRVDPQALVMDATDQTADELIDQISSLVRDLRTCNS